MGPPSPRRVRAGGGNNGHGLQMSPKQVGLASGWEESGLRRGRVKKKGQTGTPLGGPGVTVGTNRWTVPATNSQ